MGLGCGRARLVKAFDRRRGAPGRANHGHHAVHRDRLALLGPNLGHDAGDRRRNLGVHFIGRDLEERLVPLDGVANLLDPADDRAFGDRLAHLGHHDIGRHRCKPELDNRVIWVIG